MAARFTSHPPRPLPHFPTQTMSRIDYSKWDNIDMDSDEEEKEPERQKAAARPPPPPPRQQAASGVQSAVIIKPDLYVFEEVLYSGDGVCGSLLFCFIVLPSTCGW